MLLILSMSLLASPLLTMADDELERPSTRIIEPQGKTITQDGVEYRAFTVEEFRALKHLFTDYHLLWDYSLSLENDITSMEREIELWKSRMSAWEDETKRQIAYSQQLSSLFDKEHNLRLKLEKRNDALGWVPWALVVVESVAIGVFGVYAGSRLAASD
jgi:hypothetical protein